MDYKSVKKKIDFKFNKKSKYIIIIFCMIFILIITLISPKLVRAYSDKESNKKVSFYKKLINYSLAAVPVVNNGMDEVSNEKESFLKKIGFSDDESKSSSKDNKSNQKNSDGEDDEVYDKDGKVVIDPFQLDDGEVSKNVDDNDTSQNNTVSPAYNPKLKKKLNMNKPEILIYHTHTHESYKPGNASSEDQKVNVCAVGDVLTQELMQNYGICVIHDKTIHDIMYQKCYQKSGETLNRYLKKYGDFKLIIDLHRDSERNRNAVVTKLNGEDVARFMFVVDRSSPLVKDNLALANKIIPISDKLYPNLLRKTKIYYYNHGKGHFNLGKSKNVILLEMGSQVNTTEEAKKTARYIARLLAEYINK